MVPLVASVHAANAALPTVTITVGAPIEGTVATAISFTLTNPGSNQFALTGFTLVAPSGWAVSPGSCSPGAVFTTAVTSASSCQFSGGSINPGSSDSGGLGFTVTAPAPSGSNTYPYSGTFTSNVQDASGLAFYAGPTFAVQVLSPFTTGPVVTVTPGGSNTAISYSAGTAAYSISAVVSCSGAGCPASGHEAGLSITFTAPGYAGGTTFSFSPSSASTDATGTATTTFQPSNHKGDSSGVNAAIGSSGFSSTSAAIATVAGAPSTITFTSPYSGTHYLTAHGTPSTSSGNWATVAASTITASISDKFANAIDLSTLGPYTVTISAVAGGGLFDLGAGSHPTSVTCATGITCPTLAGSFTLTITKPYFQSGVYGTKGLLTAGATSTGPSFAAAGSSGNLVTTTFDTSVNAPTILGGSPSLSVAAGKTATIVFNSTLIQAGVPITFYLDSATSSAGYAGTFSNSAQAITVNTGSNPTGGAVAVFSVDTTAGATAKFFANFTRPTDVPPNLAGTTTASGDSVGTLSTVAGPASKMKVSAYFTNGCPPNLPGCLTNKVGASAVGGLTLWVDAAFSDGFGNSATNPGPNAVQVTLSVTGGVLSATTVYIPSGGSDTLVSFGPIAWTLPAGSSGSNTLTASGVVAGTSVSGTKAVGLVSPNPTIIVTSPTANNGVVYSSSTGVVFNGGANASVGYPPTVHIASVTFSVDKGAAQAATIVTGSGTGMVTWSAGVFLTVGLHNITFTATDNSAAANSATSATWKVLVDSSAPTIKFTTATGASLTYGTPAKAVIFDTEGDLNTSSIAATYNGTAVASANIQVTGTNTLGSNSSFQVSINNLPSGSWILTLTASDLAGNANAGVSIDVKVSVPFATSVVINSATYGTLGSFNGVTVSAVNLWSTSQNLVVFAVWKNGGGQTVAVTTGGLTLASGATGTTFCPLASGLPSGSYSVTVFVITTGNNPVSSSTSISVSV